MGGSRGKLISTSDRENAVKLINEARIAGARLKSACKILGISDRTYQRWTKGDYIKEDQRPITKRPSPKNKLTEEEEAKIIETANSPKYVDLPPSQIVPKLADEGEYIASQSSFYRILKKEKMNTHRSRSKGPTRKEPPTHIATGPNQIWTWDITWLNAAIKGHYCSYFLGIAGLTLLLLTKGIMD